MNVLLKLKYLFVFVHGQELVNTDIPESCLVHRPPISPTAVVANFGVVITEYGAIDPATCHFFTLSRDLRGGLRFLRAVRREPGIPSAYGCMTMKWVAPLYL